MFDLGNNRSSLGRPMASPHRSDMRGLEDDLFSAGPERGVKYESRYGYFGFVVGACRRWAAGQKTVGSGVGRSTRNPGWRFCARGYAAATKPAVAGPGQALG